MIAAESFESATQYVNHSYLLAYLLGQNFLFVFVKILHVKPVVADGALVGDFGPMDTMSRYIPLD